MAQSQRQADVHQDELCPPNKRYALMDFNKKIDLDNPLCPNESKIISNILQNHLLGCSIVASSSVPWIYLGCYIFVNNVHVDYAELLWEGLYYSLEHPSTLIPYLRFTKLFVGYYMTAYPEISRIVRDKYYNLEYDEMVKSIFISGKNKAGVGMKIPNWMITDEMKLTKNYQMYVEAFRVDVPMPLEKVNEHLVAKEIDKMVEGTENVDVDEPVSSIPNSQNDPGTRLDPGSYKESPEVEIIADVQPVNVIEAEEESAEDDYKLRRRVKGKHVEESRSTLSPTPIRSPRIYSTLISSDTGKLQELTITDTKLSSSTPSSSSPKPTLSMSQHILSLFKPKTGRFKRYKSFFDELQGRYGYLFGHIKTRFLARKKFNVLTQHLHEVMEELLPNMVDDRVKELTKTQVPIYVANGLLVERKHNQVDMAKMITDAIQQECDNLRAEITSQINNAITNHIPSQANSSVRNYMSSHILHVHPTQARLTTTNTLCRFSAIRLRDQDDHHDDAHPKGENSAKRKKTSEHGTYVMRESSSGQANESESGPSTSELVEEMSETVDEAKLHKVIDEMLRQRCTSGDEHQYRIDQMQNFLKNDIVDPKAPALSLPNQDLLYLKKGNSGPEKIVLSLHKFPAVIFSDDDIEEGTSRWVNKCVKKFNPYDQYSVKHWKNPYLKIFYIKRQKESGKPIEEIYSNLKIVQVIKTTGKLGHEHKFVTEIITWRANGSIVKVDDYAETGILWSLLVFIRSIVIWKRVYDFQLGVESYQHNVNLTAPTITFPDIEKKKMFSIVSEPIYGIIYKNSKKEKRVMGHQEIHKFCDATLKRFLEGLKSYNNDVKHGYVTPSLSKEDAE
ncbi:hypothetical protein Tco_1548270 [Tanacetum coccineum]